MLSVSVQMQLITVAMHWLASVSGRARVTSVIDYCTASLKLAILLHTLFILNSLSLNVSNISLPQTKFYVDDSFSIIERNQCDKFFKHINTIGKFYRNIQFTKEQEQDNTISFLDVKLSRFNSQIKTNIHRKPTQSDRYLNFNSHHPLQVKKSVIKAITNRAFTHINELDSLENEINKLKTILNKNKYPDKIINDTIQQCKNRQNTNNPNKSEFDKSQIIAIPYYRGLSERIRDILNPFGIKTVFKRGKTIKNIIYRPNKKQKTKLSNVVYGVNCLDCNAKYIGETSRNHDIRIKEHQRATENNKPNSSDIADHGISEKHKIDFENPEVSYSHRIESSRKFLESWEIEKHKQNKIPLMNKQLRNVTTIPKSYLSLIKK